MNVFILNIIEIFEDRIMDIIKLYSIISKLYTVLTIETYNIDKSVHKRTIIDRIIYHIRIIYLTHEIQKNQIYRKVSYKYKSIDKITINK